MATTIEHMGNAHRWQECAAITVVCCAHITPP